MKAFPTTPDVSHIHLEFHQPNILLDFSEKLSSIPTIMFQGGCFFFLATMITGIDNGWKLSYSISPPHKECGKQNKSQTLSNWESGICEFGKLLVDKASLKE